MMWMRGSERAPRQKCGAGEMRVRRVVWHAHVSKQLSCQSAKVFALARPYPFTADRCPGPGIMLLAWRLGKSVFCGLWTRDVAYMERQKTHVTGLGFHVSNMLHLESWVRKHESLRLGFTAQCPNWHSHSAQAEARGRAPRAARSEQYNCVHRHLGHGHHAPALWGLLWQLVVHLPSCMSDAGAALLSVTALAKFSMAWAYSSGCVRMCPQCGESASGPST